MDSTSHWIPHHMSEFSLCASNTRPNRAKVGPAMQVDPAEWRLEVERVAPRLKITVTSSARDWRAHLDEAHKHSAEINSVWPAAQSALSATQTEVPSACLSHCMAGLGTIQTTHPFTAAYGVYSGFQKQCVIDALYHSCVHGTIVVDTKPESGFWREIKLL